VNSTLDYEISRVPPDASVCDESKDLCMRGLVAAISFHLLALE
jgi:hypothetical protein